MMLGASGLWLGIQKGAGGTATELKAVWLLPMTPWKTGFIYVIFER